MAFGKFKGIFNLDKGHDDYEDDFDEFDDDYDDFDDEDEEDDEEEAPKKKFKDRFTKKQSVDDEDEDLYDDFSEPIKEPEKKKPKFAAKQSDFFGRKPNESRVINMSKSSSYSNSAGQIYMLKPKKIDDAKAAVDALLNGKVVILNLEGIALDLAQSVTDFISGASYCISGNFSTISANVFVYTPNGFDLTGAFEDDFLGSGMRDF